MDIQLYGLTTKEQALCDIMWAIETRDGVESFIKTLPETDQRTCRALIELMQLAFADEVDSVDEAKSVLTKIMGM